jgi:hypothetical protein
MPDPFKGFANIESAPESWYVVVPSDVADLPTIPKALFFKAAGNVVLRGSDGVEITLAVTVNQRLDLRPTRVKATGTTVTATNIIALV